MQVNSKTSLETVLFGEGARDPATYVSAKDWTQDLTEVVLDFEEKVNVSKLLTESWFSSDIFTWN